ncbi:MAG TPA: ABC transporter substrate-binding protein [Spirochaetales bacterium]|nr:ABC transporter substrate-binding protein [Spirochaetales bacterium]HRY56234.1 ABC transporter substrate-binding protein [Spirochaetia bacterium]HRZ65353.1 ABC transporter substrate-binding protein [Spirochaetia bacterium]
MSRLRQALAALALAAFAAVPPLAAQAAAPFSLVDALGRRVAFEKAPTRVVMTNKAVIMIADAAYLFPEAPARIAALGNTKQGKHSFAADYDPSFAAKIALDNQSGPEQIAAANPDAVLLKSSLAGSLGKSIEALGIPVVYLDLETPAQYERDLLILGALFRDEARARELIALYNGRTGGIAKALAGLAEAAKPKALMLYYTDQGGAVSFNVPPLGWIQTGLVTMGGGIPAWRDAKLGQGWTKVSVEQVAAWDPDKIFVIAYTADPAAVVERLKADPQWAALRASAQGGILPFPGDYYSWDQPDARWPLGLAWVAKKLHPELLADLDLRAEARAFYRDFYGMGDADFARLVAPKLPAELR